MRHVWDDGAPRGDGNDDVIGEWLLGSVKRVNGMLPEHYRFAFGGRPENFGQQREWTGRVNKARRGAMLAAAGIWDKARLEATAAPKSGSWPEALPSVAMDTQLSNAEVQYGVERRLGVAL